MKDALAEDAAAKHKKALEYGQLQGVLKVLEKKEENAEKQVETDRRNQAAKELLEREEVGRREIEEALSQRKAEDLKAAQEERKAQEEADLKAAQEERKAQEEAAR